MCSTATADPCDEWLADPKIGVSREALASKPGAATSGGSGQSTGTGPAGGEEGADDWQKRQPEFDEAAKQVEELEDWGDEQAESLESSVDEIRGDANEKNYKDATAALDKLLPELKPVYEEYLKQKAAKEKYDPAWQALQPRLLTGPQPYAKLEPLQDEINDLRTQVETGAESKDYVKALDLLNELTPKVDAYEAAKKELDTKKEAYEKARAALEPRFPAPNQEGGTAVTTQQGEIDSKIADMNLAAQEEDFDTALQQVSDLEPLITAFEALLQERDRYTDRLAELQPKLPTQTEPGAGKIAEVQDAIKTLKTDSESAASEGDYTTALQKLDELEPKIDELAAIIEARGRFEEAFKQVQPRIPTASEPGNGRLESVQEEIATLSDQIQAATDETDYEKGLSLVEELEPKLDEFEQLRDQRDQYDKAWAELKPQLPTTSEKGPPKEMELEQQVSDLSAKVESTAASGDYEEALKQIDLLKAKLEELTTEHEANEKKKADYDKRYAAIKNSLDMALENPSEVKEIQAAQDAVKAKKSETETAAAAGDYDTATARIGELETALKAYQEELRKTPRTCDWVLATAVELQGLIQIKYLQASNKILSAAQAYDDALAAHTGALKKVQGAKELAENLLAGIFFAGLGGFVGGAVGSGMKMSVIGKEFADLAANSGVIDATKDVAKFVVKYKEKMGGGKAGDPTHGLASIGGSGVVLARNIGKAVNTQGAALIQEVVDLARLVKTNGEKCNEGGVRVEGDPTEALGSDPFLKALGTIADADKKTFAQLLWGQWIETYAYTVEWVCQGKAGCHYKVDDNVEGFFEWWEDLTKNIEAQAGEDFGLRDRLNKARAEAEAKKEKGNWGG